MPRKSAFKCYFGCIPFKGRVHSFPPPEYPHMDKFQQWKMVLSEADRAKGDKYIRYNLHICDHHFEDFYRTCTGRLTKNAVPTLMLKHSNINIEECVAPQEESFSWQRNKEAILIKPVTEVPDETGEMYDSDSLSLYCDDSRTIIQEDLKDTHEEDVMLHVGFHCNVCKGEIKGFRYTCVQCNDLDLCSACELDGAHAQHYMLRVPKPKPFAETEMVLDRIRRHLMRKLDPIAGPDEDMDDISLKMEVKSEVDDQEAGMRLNANGISSDLVIDITKDTKSDEQVKAMVTDVKSSASEVEQIKSDNTRMKIDIKESTIINSVEKVKTQIPRIPNTSKRKLLVKLNDIMKTNNACTARRLSVVLTPLKQLNGTAQYSYTQKQDRHKTRQSRLKRLSPQILPIVHQKDPVHTYSKKNPNLDKG